MSGSIDVACVAAGELPAAFNLSFRRLPEGERAARVRQALELVRTGEFDAAGVWLARDRRGLLGVMLCAPLPGAGGIVWPPQVELHPRQTAIEDRLIAATSAWLQQQGVKLAQALLAPEDKFSGESLLRNGFRRITQLWSMSRALPGVEPPAGPARLSFEPYSEGNHDLFQRTLVRTYEGTRDCPEVDGVRTIDEIMVAHRAQGRHDPDKWWLVRFGAQVVGVLLLTENPESRSWDLVYLGVVKEARGQGFGRDLTLHALAVADGAGAEQITLAVDERNQPAWDLYRELGFEPYDRRSVYLAIWSRGERGLRG